jgi:NAD-dependent SIR2 family protein deacetylase
MTDERTMTLVQSWLRASKRVLIGAGAGLSVAAGIDYGDTRSFAKLFPALVRKGFSARYQLIGFDRWSPAEHWGYWATHVHDVRFRHRDDVTYRRLFELVRDKDYFVLTSNVDAMFARHGFDERRLFTPQGDYARMQCVRACRNETWPSKPAIDRLLAATDAVTQEVTDPSALPRCPSCGGDVFMNVRLDDAFVEVDYEEQGDRFVEWLNSAMGEPTLLLEIGAGFNTPVVVRWRMEQLAHLMPDARLARINLADARVPSDLRGRAVSMAADAGTVIAALHAA